MKIVELLLMISAAVVIGAGFSLAVMKIAVFLTPYL